MILGLCLQEEYGMASFKMLYRKRQNEGSSLNLTICRDGFSLRM